jgi:hypothetical protein
LSVSHLHLAWRPDVAEPLLDTVDHQFRIISPEIPGRCGHPADNLAVMAVQSKGNLHDLAIPRSGDRHPTRPIVRNSSLMVRAIGRLGVDVKEAAN